MLRKIEIPLNANAYMFFDHPAYLNKQFMKSHFCLCVSIISFMITSGCTPQNQVADTVLFNGKIITMDKDFSEAKAVAIKQGKIISVGDDRAILALAGDATHRINLQGHAVIPGIIEGHSHIVAASQSEYFDAIPDVHTVKDVLEWITKETQTKEAGEWIIHPKFFFTRLEEMRQLTKRELDSVAPGHPVFLNGSYGGMINTKAIEVAGIATRNHPGILREEATGEASGFIRSSAFRLLPIKNETSFTDAQKLEALKALIRNYNKVGITSVVSGKGTLEELKMFEELLQRDELGVRIFHNMAFPFNPKAPEEEMQESLQKFGYKTGDGNEWIRIGALKAVLDGGVLTGTAFLHEPWGERAKEVYGITDSSYRGELFLSKRELIRLITVADETGWKFTAHVTGGGGVDTLLAAFEEVNQSRPIRGKRFSIIHGNFFTPDAISKMADMEIYADMQPAWFYKDTKLLHQVLGEERINAFHPYHSMMQAGIVVNGGSDHMVKLDPDVSINPYNPFPAMWSVITRKTDRGEIFNADEAISRREALQMYTINNAYASFEEDIKGSIEVGKLADLVVLSADILTCPDSIIREIKPVLTLVNGRIVYESGELK